MDDVGDLLAARREERVPWGSATALAFLLHAAVLVVFLASALARPIHYARPRVVAVRLLAAGSLRAPEPPRTEPAPAPPPATEKPRIEKPPPEDLPPPPSKKAVLLPAKEDKKKPTPVPISRPGPSAPPISLPSAGVDTDLTGSGVAAGEGGTARIGGFKIDQADFKYAVYIEQLQWALSKHYLPTQRGPNNPVVHFRILRDGTVSDVRIVASSGLPFADRQAERAVLDSSPMPPLPADYDRSEIGIQVVFE